MSQNPQCRSTLNFQNETFRNKTVYRVLTPENVSKLDELLSSTAVVALLVSHEWLVTTIAWCQDASS